MKAVLHTSDTAENTLEITRRHNSKDYNVNVINCSQGPINFKYNKTNNKIPEDSGLDNTSLLATCDITELQAKQTEPSQLSVSHCCFSRLP